MKVFSFLFFFFSFPPSSLSMEEEVVFELKRENKKSNEAKRKQTIPLKFRRKSFSYSDDFVVFNEKPKSDIKKGTALRVNIPYPIIASFSEEFPIYGVVTYPFKAVLSGTIKGVKNTNKALILFDEIILNNEAQSIKQLSCFP